MPDPYEISIGSSVEVLGLLNGVLKNCVKEKIQPSCETVEGVLGVLENLRNAETKHLDRIAKAEQRVGTSLYK